MYSGKKKLLNTRTQAIWLQYLVLKKNSSKHRDDMPSYCGYAVIKQVPENGKRHDNSKQQHLLLFEIQSDNNVAHKKVTKQMAQRKKKKKDRLVSWIHACFWGKSKPWKDLSKSSGFRDLYISVWGPKTESYRETKMCTYI